MKGEGENSDPRISRTYFNFPIYLAMIFLVTILLMLPTIFYGGFHLILEESGPYFKWYFIYCIVLTTIISAAFALQFDLLFCLAEHAGQVLSREQLYSYVWNQDIQYNVDELVKAHIKAFRREPASPPVKNR